MPMCQSGKYHTTTPSDVRMLQNVNYERVSRDYKSVLYEVH